MTRLVKPFISLKDHTLNLSHLLKVDIPNKQRPENTKTDNARPGRQHPSLRIPVCSLDSQSRRRSNSILLLQIQILIDRVELRHRRRRQIPRERFLERIRPDRTGDRASHCAADGADDAQDSQGRCNVLVVHGGKDSELLDDDEDAAADGDEDLAHHQVSDGLVGATEVDHEPLGEDVQRHSDVEEPLEAAGAADQVSDNQEEHAGDDVEGVADVAGFGEGEVVDDLQEGGVVVEPAVVGDLVCGVEETGADDGAVFEDLEVEHGDWRCVCFVQDEDDQHHDADDDHRDDVSGGPAIRGLLGDFEREEEDDETGREDEDAECCSG